MTTKEELFEKIKSKAIVELETLEEEYKKERESFSKKGIPEEQLDKFTLTRIRTLYKKQLASPAAKLVGTIIGDQGVTDFGAKNQYDKIKTLWSEADEVIKKTMIKDGIADVDGNPLWHSDNTKAKWKYEDDTGVTKEVGQRRINYEYERQRPLVLISRREDETEYKLSFLTLRGDKLDIKLPMFVEMPFRAIIRKDEEGIFQLNQSTVTLFNAKGSREVDVVELFKKVIPNHLVGNLSQLKDYFESNRNGGNRFCVVKGTIFNINLESKYNTILSIDDNSIEIEDSIVCFLSKNYPINFVEGSQDCLFVGWPSVRLNPQSNEEEVQMNMYGVFVDKVWRVKEVVPSTKVEEEEQW